MHTVLPNFTLQTGDPLGPASSGSDGGSCIWGLLPNATTGRTFTADFIRKLKHSERGTVSMATAPSGRADDDRVAGSQFIITLGENLDYLDGKAAIFGQVVEGFDALEKINETFCDDKGRPLVDIRIKHTVIIDDPFPDPKGMLIPTESPVPTKAQLATVRIGEDEALQGEEGEEEAEKRRREREARAQALTLEMVGDLPFAEVKPPENVLFVCKLNPVTTGMYMGIEIHRSTFAVQANIMFPDEDLELIFSRFGTILSCEVIRDKRTGDSLQYAFIEYEEQPSCEQAYFKMQGVLIDDHRIHVDFSQSVSKLSDSWRTATNTKRRQTGGGFGGISGLEKKSQYRAGDYGRRERRDKFVYDEDEMRSRHKRDRREDDRLRRSQSPRDDGRSVIIRERDRSNGHDYHGKQRRDNDRDYHRR